MNLPINPIPSAICPAEFGTLFRRERKALGLTLEQVGKLAGCRRQTIADLEAGKNVGSLTLFKALSVIGKQLEIQPLERNRDFLGEDWDE